MIRLGTIVNGAEKVDNRAVIRHRAGYKQMRYAQKCNAPPSCVIIAGCRVDIQITRSRVIVEKGIKSFRVGEGPLDEKSTPAKTLGVSRLSLHAGSRRCHKSF